MIKPEEFKPVIIDEEAEEFGESVLRQRAKIYELYKLNQEMLSDVLKFGEGYRVITNSMCDI